MNALPQTELGHTAIAWSVYTDIAACGPLWRTFQASALRTAFQCYEWQSAWYEAIGRHEGVEPFIAVGRVEGNVKIIFPLARDRRLSVRRLTWLAAEFCDYTAPLIAPEFAARLSDDDAEEILQALIGLADVDYVLLEKQPLILDGVTNRFATRESGDYTASAYALRLGGDWETTYAELRSSKTRRRLRDKEKRLEKAGALAFRRLAEPDEISSAVTTLLDWKVAQIAARGMVNPFTDSRVDDFLSCVLTSAPDFGRCYAIELDGEMLAGAIVLVDGVTFTIFQMAYGLGPHAKHSPGQILLNRMMQEAIAEGLQVFDLSLGDEAYKREICDVQMDLTQSSRPVTAAGLLPHMVYQVKIGAKRSIKASPRLSEAFFTANRLARKLGFVAEGRTIIAADPGPPSEVSAQTRPIG
ncbi:MAG: GNAT family N-acetyltransferase [Hyphomicrobiales bacterium]|nr:GNAT family N-acetyltransferase [Hyphomicrobiales bacterium]